MDFVSSTLITLSEPKGFWQTILDAFKNGLGTYILAVILIAVIVRLLFSLVDIVNKKVTMKNTEINSKMKPELDAIKQKYGNDPAMMQQKTNEIYKKYQFNMMGSCIPMLITMVLQFTVFLTLWNSLQAVSNFNIAEKYQDIKNIYANVININSDENVLSGIDEVGLGENDHLKVEILTNKDGTKYMKVFVVKPDEEIDIGREVVFDDSLANSNEAVFGLIDKYVPEPEPENSVTAQEKTVTRYSKQILEAANDAVEENYLATQEGFLWIKNIYKAESPTSPVFTKAEIKKYLSNYYDKTEKAVEKENDYEGKIFDYVIAGIDTKELGLNGYYLLTIIAVATSVLWLSNRLMRRKGEPAQKQSWAMYVIMPLIIGIFTFMYTSLFAIYLIVGQLMMLVLTPLTTLIVRKWTDHDDKKKKEKTEVVVDYRRKDI